MSIKEKYTGEIYHHFQPVFNLTDKKTFGFEALLRTGDNNSPENIFQNAKVNGLLYELDLLSIEKAIVTYSSTGYTIEEGKLFLNILPSTILHDTFLEFIMTIVRKNYLFKQEIILEISESEFVEQYETFRERIYLLKELGFRIAIDDYGKGYSDIKNILELEPHYLKLDRYFSKNLALSSKKQELISFIKNFCEKYGCNIILEGIERKTDLETAYNLGVQYAQGYLLSKPIKLNTKTLQY
ncbi:EAL domain-containing protein [Fredinandcohnia sp. QZ13]|uniref:EAL domain-containing protein n=1 Tax=Fredinandcohnia sp. QZ13 TaxID=3073144 RepID=UPI002853212F|nr:EAL domain-containing protein [Fredinandcohnia sp. QZ13]MDR4886278.1 EAL domain-containing protein [Fredinandcohnia sp. QZ13]